jgi:hypothetical protein
MTKTRRQFALTIQRPRRVRQVLRDLGVGLAIFLLLLPLLGVPTDCWSVSRASASDHLAARAIEATSPPGLDSENAVLGAVLFGARPLKLQSQPATLIVIGLTFTVLFAFNLGLWRHLRRVSASPRRGEWRRSR